MKPGAGQSFSRPAKPSAGFTLVEVMISLVILAIILLGAFYGMSAGFRNSEDAKNLTAAAHLAEEKMEDLINLDFTAGGLVSGAYSDTGALAADEYINFTRDWTVDDGGNFAPGAPGTSVDPHAGAAVPPNFKKATLTVRHTPSLVKVTLVRYLSNY